jgi:hypothetical protein
MGARISRDVHSAPPAQRPCEQRADPDTLGGAPLILNQDTKRSPVALAVFQQPHRVSEGALAPPQKSWANAPGEGEQILKRIPDARPRASEQREKIASRHAYLRRDGRWTIGRMSRIYSCANGSAGEVKINQLRDRIRLAPESKRLTHRARALRLGQAREVEDWLSWSLFARPQQHPPRHARQPWLHPGGPRKFRQASGGQITWNTHCSVT